MQIDATHPLFPIASVVAGVFLLIAPLVVRSLGAPFGTYPIQLMNAQNLA